MQCIKTVYYTYTYGQISLRSKTIATYALCGFANPASIGIQIASFTTLAPTRRADFSRYAIRAYVAGSMACFMTACIAGALIGWINLKCQFVFIVQCT